MVVFVLFRAFNVIYFKCIVDLLNKRDMDYCKISVLQDFPRTIR